MHPMKRTVLPESILTVACFHTSWDGNAAYCYDQLSCITFFFFTNLKYIVELLHSLVEVLSDPRF